GAGRARVHRARPRSLCGGARQPTERWRSLTPAEDAHRDVADPEGDPDRRERIGLDVVAQGIEELAAALHRLIFDVDDPRPQLVDLVVSLFDEPAYVLLDRVHAMLQVLVSASIVGRHDHLRMVAEHAACHRALPYPECSSSSAIHA